MWWTILLSALLHSASFIFPDYLGWMILIFWIPLLFVRKHFFRAGFFWGIIAFGLHFIWLMELLYTKSNASLSLAIVLYLCVVIYFALTSGVWFFVCGLVCGFVCRSKKPFDKLRANGPNQKLCRKELSRRILRKNKLSFSLIISLNSWLKDPFALSLSKGFFERLNFMWRFTTFLATFTAYSIFLNKYSLWFFYNIYGYPFLNPSLPLIKYKWFIFLLTFLGLSGTRVGNDFYIKPIESGAYEIEFANKKKGLLVSPEDMYPDMHGIAIYEKLKAIYKGTCARTHAHAREAGCIFMPETSFLTPLTNDSEWIELWGNVLPKNTHLFLGGVREEEGRWHQTVYWIHMGRIILNYDKQIMFDFTENVKGVWSNFAWANNLFLKDKHSLEESKNKNEISFVVNSELSIAPFICSDYFFSSNKKRRAKNTLNCLFINDTWFLDYFGDLLVRYIKVNAFLAGNPVLCVGYKTGLMYFE